MIRQHWWTEDLIYRSVSGLIPFSLLQTIDCVLPALYAPNLSLWGYHPTQPQYSLILSLVSPFGVSSNSKTLFCFSKHCFGHMVVYVGFLSPFTVFELCVLTTASYSGLIVATEWSRASTTHALLYMRRLTTGTLRSITWKLGRLNTWLTRTAIRWSSRWLSRCTMRPSTSSSSISARVTPHRLISALVLLSEHLSYVNRLP